MKVRLEQQLAAALDTLKAEGIVPADVTPAITVTRTRDPSHGDFATNLAMLLARPAQRSPRDIAQAIMAALPASEAVRDVTIAGPGFINFFQANDAQRAVVARIVAQGEAYGRSALGKGRRVLVEFVSADPTGPLHVGHGRGAALGATISNLLHAVGFNVHREYYVNDAGRQMDILAVSVWLRYLEQCGEEIAFPSNGYRGDYIDDIAIALRSQAGMSLHHEAARVCVSIAPDEPHGGDKQPHVDDLISCARKLLGETAYRQVFDLALDSILTDIKDDLAEFGVTYDTWFSERALVGEIHRVVDKLDTAGHVYIEDGARWFRSSALGDDKDRVLVRENGQTTCFASDIAYINNTFERGFDKVLYLFGSEHHGYTARLFAVCAALGYPRDMLEFLPIRFATLYRGGERVPMSTRAGSFVTFRELRDEVGRDAARYFYVMRKYRQHLDFDLDLARSSSRENPVYYVQYARARICSVQRQLTQRGLRFDQALGLNSLELLDAPAEADLLTLLATYPEIIERAALSREPHQLTGYLRDLANALHTYYNAHKILLDDEALRCARLCLLLAVKQVLTNGLTLIDVSTPEVM